MPRPLPLEEKETLDHGPLPRQCDVHLCSVPIQTGNSCGSGLVSSFASSSRLFCGDMWNKHWLVIFDFREEWALICEATQNSAGNLKGECLWKERDIILNEPYSYKKCLGQYKIPHGIIVDVVATMRDFGKYDMTQNNCQIWVQKLLNQLEIQVPQDQPDAKTVVKEIIEPSLWTTACSFLLGGAAAIAKFVLFK